MAGTPLTGQGGQFGGPQYGWGGVPNQPGTGARSGSAGSRTNFNSGFTGGAYNTSPEAGLHRGEWQWRGHGPSAQQSYGWDYQGGVGRDEITQHTEARTGSSFQARMAQERSGGLPQGRYAIDYDQGRRTGGQGGQDVSYDWGWEGHGGGQQGGMNPRYGATGQRYGGDYRSAGGHAGPGVGYGGGQQGGMNARYGSTSQRYGGDYRSAGGYVGSGAGYGGGNPQGRGGYGREFGGGYGRERGYGGGMRAGGRYGAQNYDRGMRGRMGGGYDGPYQQPLSDADFYRRVERW
jgi:hypothetical protein